MTLSHAQIATSCRSPYPDLWHRVVANSSDAEGQCWIWTGKTDRWGYGRLNLYVPGLGRVVTLQAHVLAYVLMHGDCRAPADAWLAYRELQAAGLELDHLCRDPRCINPDHLEPVTPAENCRRRSDWRYQ